MKKFGIIIAAAMLFMSASSFAQAITPKKEVKKEAVAKAPAHKKHTKHHHAAKTSAAPAAPKAK
jgi:phage host-nuclease inhibitor protein Gam